MYSARVLHNLIKQTLEQKTSSLYPIPARFLFGKLSVLVVGGAKRKEREKMGGFDFALYTFLEIDNLSFYNENSFEKRV